LKIVFAILFCFLNTVWALTSGGFRIVSDTLVISYMYCGIRYMLPMRTIKYCSVVVGVTFGVLVINTSSTVSHEQQTTPLISDESHQLATVRHSCVYNTGSRTVDNMRWSDIFVENCILPTTATAHSTLQYGMTPSIFREYVWCSLNLNYWVTVWWRKLLVRYVKPFPYNTGTWRTDRQTELLMLRQYHASVCWHAIKILVHVICTCFSIELL